MFENYDGTAVEPMDFGEPEQPNEETVDETGQEPAPVGTQENASVPTEIATENAPVSNEPKTYEIEGVGTFTADQIKELQQGSLRQSDYTRKTQELAKQREENKEAVELYNHLKANPQLIEAMRNAENGNAGAMRYAPTPENQMLKDIAFKQNALEVDMKLTELHQKYGDFDETELFRQANEMNVPISSLEFVCKGMLYDNNKVDERAIIDKAKAELKAELEQNRNNVSTTVDTKQKPVETNTPSLTADEKRVAQGLGLSEEEYLKWK